MKPIETTNLIPANIELINISASYKTLHFDDFPILFMGVNKFGNKILGSHLEEDDDEKVIWTIQSIISNEEYYEFINTKKSYKEILNKSTTKYLVEKGFNGKILNAYALGFGDIPVEYQPLDSSFCPNYKKAYSLEFCLGLKGQVADYNRAIAAEITSIQTSFSKFLEGLLKNLQNIDIQPSTYLQPYSPGSFKINIELEFKNKNGLDLFSDKTPIGEYVGEYVKYISTSIVEDKEQFLNDEVVEESDEYKKLLSSFENIYTKGHIKSPENPNQALKENLKKSLSLFEGVTEQIGKNFDTIEFSNYKGKNKEKNEEFISIIDKNYSQVFQNTVEAIEEAKSTIVVDEDFKSYEIHISHLDKDTRQGNAFIRNLDNTSEMSKPKIKILEKEPLGHTKYTESLHLDKWIIVKAKAKLVNNKFKFLEIQYENE